MPQKNKKPERESQPPPTQEPPWPTLLIFFVIGFFVGDALVSEENKESYQNFEDQRFFIFLQKVHGVRDLPRLASAFLARTEVLGSIPNTI